MRWIVVVLTFTFCGCDGSSPPAGDAPTDDPVDEPVSNTFVQRLDTTTSGCLARLLPDDTNSDAHTYVAAVIAGPCSCSVPGRAELTAYRQGVIRSAAQKAGVCTVESCANEYCTCDVPRAAGDSLTACMTAPDPISSGDGWCYVQPAAGLGSYDLMTECGADSQLLRLIGTARPATGEAFFLAREAR